MSESTPEAAKHATEDVVAQVAQTAPGVTVEREEASEDERAFRDDAAHERIDGLEAKVEGLLNTAKETVEELTDGDDEVMKPTGRPWTHAFGRN